jgi:hypothetical protein
MLHVDLTRIRVDSTRSGSAELCVDSACMRVKHYLKQQQQNKRVTYCLIHINLTLMCIIYDVFKVIF